MNDYGMKYSFFQFVSAVLVLKLCALMFLLSLFLMKPCPKYNTACICISSVLLLEAISCSKNHLFFFLYRNVDICSWCTHNKASSSGPG